MSEIIKCRWCAATFLKWRTLRTGRKVSGFTMLKDHTEDWHPEEAKALQDALGPQDEE